MVQAARLPTFRESRVPQHTCNSYQLRAKLCTHCPSGQRSSREMITISGIYGPRRNASLWHGICSSVDTVAGDHVGAVNGPLKLFIDKKDEIMNLSASSIIGDDVVNGQGDDLGKIEDLMVDCITGTVSYAVLSFGGFLGIGDKLFAVPLEAMSLDTENQCFVLNESKERLEAAPGFDKSNWPNHSDKTWFSTVRNYYKA